MSRVKGGKKTCLPPLIEVNCSEKLHLHSGNFYRNFTVRELPQMKRLCQCRRQFRLRPTGWNRAKRPCDRISQDSFRGEKQLMKKQQKPAWTKSVATLLYTLTVIIASAVSSRAQVEIV